MKKIYISFGIITFVLGMMIAMQYRSNGFVDQGISSDRSQEIQLEISRLDKDTLKIDQEIIDLEGKLEKAKRGVFEAQEAITDEYKKGKISSGLVPLSGSGIEIFLDNPSPSINSVSIIRDEDLLRLSNELKIAGAEALAINNQRIISTSEIRLAGSFININLERVNPPFRIAAIGNQEKLKSALEINNGLLDYFRDLGMAVSVKEQNNITIPAYNKKLQFNYAKAVRKDD